MRVVPDLSRAARRTLPSPVAIALGVAILAGPVAPAWALSGDGPLNPDNPTEVPTYTVPASTCGDIRAAIGQSRADGFDIILACSIAGRSSDPDDTPCDLIDGALNAGTPIGQCSDSFPVPLNVAGTTGDDLEKDVDLAASAGGQNLSLADRDRVSVTSVASGLGNLLGLVDVRVCGPEDDCSPGPASCGGIPVVRSETACNELTAQLTSSVLAQPPPLSHGLFLDVEATATSDFLSVAVCPSHSWTCGDAAAGLSGTGYEGQVRYSIAYTPLCLRYARMTVCCTTNASGQCLK